MLLALLVLAACAGETPSSESSTTIEPLVSTTAATATSTSVVPAEEPEVVDLRFRPVEGLDALPLEVIEQDGAWLAWTRAMQEERTLFTSSDGEAWTSQDVVVEGLPNELPLDLGGIGSSDFGHVMAVFANLNPVTGEQSSSLIQFRSVDGVQWKPSAIVDLSGAEFPSNLRPLGGWAHSESGIAVALIRPAESEYPLNELLETYTDLESELCLLAAQTTNGTLELFLCTGETLTVDRSNVAGADFAKFQQCAASLPGGGYDRDVEIVLRGDLGESEWVREGGLQVGPELSPGGVLVAIDLGNSFELCADLIDMPAATSPALLSFDVSEGSVASTDLPAEAVEFLRRPSSAFRTEWSDDELFIWSRSGVWSVHGTTGVWTKHLASSDISATAEVHELAASSGTAAILDGTEALIVRLADSSVCAQGTPKARGGLLLGPDWLVVSNDVSEIARFDQCSS